MPVLLSWAILWSLGETICPAELGKGTAQKQQGPGTEWQSSAGTQRSQLTTCEILLRPCPCVFFLLSPQVMLLSVIESGSFI